MAAKIKDIWDEVTDWNGQYLTNADFNIVVMDKEKYTIEVKKVRLDPERNQLVMEID